ncbi:MAG TPA: hypothetical protein VK968_02510 [Roseimicrobium sp.]|nr:hypothetical protein [Roseimicrobium sp.]
MLSIDPIEALGIAEKHGTSNRVCYFRFVSALDKIKAATAELNPDEQYELFRWWTESDSFKQRQLASLRQDIAFGIQQLQQGHYQVFSESNVMQLADEIGRSGRADLGKVRKPSEG